VLIETTGRLETLRFPAGEAVVRQSEVADTLYIITRGEVEVTQLDQLGSERHVRRLKAGQYFGEMGVLTRSTRAATVRACTPVEVLSVDRATLGALLDRSQATADELARVVRTRLATSPEPGG